MDGSKVVSLLMVGLLLLTAMANVSSESPASRGPTDNTDSEPNGDIEIDGFSGDIRASDSLVFSGNVTRVRDNNWAIG